MAYNDNITGNKILSGKDGGVPYWGDDGGDHALPFGVDKYSQPNDIPNSFIWQYWQWFNPSEDKQDYLDSWALSDQQTSKFSDAFGTKWKTADPGTRWSAMLGDVHELAEDVRIGYLGTFSYKSDASGYKGGKFNKYVVENSGGDPSDPCTDDEPCYNYQRPRGDSNAAEFDVTKGTESVLWAGAVSTGFESPWINIGLTYLRSQTAEYTAVEARDDKTYDYDDGTGTIWRNHSLYYSERMTETTLLQVEHPWFFLPRIWISPVEGDWFVFQSACDRLVGQSEYRLSV